MTDAHPPRRRTVGRDAMLAAMARRLLPERWFYRIVLGSLKKR
jgi:hypothetical protein